MSHELFYISVLIIAFQGQSDLNIVYSIPPYHCSYDIAYICL